MIFIEWYMLTGRHADRSTHRHVNRSTCRQVAKPTGREADRSTRRQVGSPVADLEGVQDVRSNPPLEPNHFVFMGNLKKFLVILG